MVISKKFTLFLSFLSFFTIAQSTYGALEATDTEAILTLYHKKLSAPDATASILSTKEITEIAQLLSYESVEQFIQEFDVLTDLKQEVISLAHKKGILIPVTPTDAILMTYDSRAKEHLKENFESYPKLLPLLAHLVQQENEELSNHNHVFYHGLRKDIYMSMYIHTKIVELISPISPHFLMLRSPLDTYSPEYLPSILRTHFVKNGSKDGDGALKDRYHLLSTNHSIFGNLYNAGECTLYYFLNNHSWKNCDATYESLFAYYNIKDLYKKHAQELENLTIKSPSGILLQISLGNKIAQKVCYLSKPSGYKTRVTDKKSFFSWTNNQTDRTHVMTKSGIVDELNELQWRLVLTDDLLLNPQNKDFKITAYTLEQESLTAFHAKVDAIFEAIKKDLLAQKRKVIKPVKKGWFNNRLTWPIQKLHINKDSIAAYNPYRNTKKSHIIPSLIRDGLFALSALCITDASFNAFSRKKHLTNKQETQKIFLAAIGLLGTISIDVMMHKNII